MAASQQEPPAPPQLHELEQEVMEEVWRLGETPGRAVLQGLNERSGRTRAYTTIMTILNRLHEKGLLKRRREGKGDVYAATLSREGYADARAAAQVDALVDEWGELAFVHFAKQMEALDPDRRQQLSRLARRA
ncbi:MAG: BlaI/MecI/CopY family transcriptional regulator [Solirubrobacteraceae bacterium]